MSSLINEKETTCEVFHMTQCDYLIVGADLYGAVFDQQVKDNKKCLRNEKCYHKSNNSYLENEK